MLTNQLKQQLSSYETKQLYRRRLTRSSQATLINFSSNDYLGLSQHPAVIQTLQKTAGRYGIGSGASSLVSGYTQMHKECEVAFAEFLQRDRALLFGNGFMANLGVIDALTHRGDYLYEDRHNHASLLDGARLSNAKLLRYRHKNLFDLETRIAAQRAGQTFIASDSVFSILGDIAPIDSLAKLCRKVDGTLIIDDAHGLGVLGQQGRGSLELFGLTQKDVPVLVCPLGKAIGTYGAIVAGSHEFIESFIQFARSYIYTTALPPALASATTKSLEILQKESWRRETLQDRIRFFRQAAKERGVHLCDSATPIQAILIGQPERAVAQSERLKKQGFWVYPMRPPTVPEDSSLLRITLNSCHTESQILQLLDAMR